MGKEETILSANSLYVLEVDQWVMADRGGGGIRKKCQLENRGVTETKTSKEAKLCSALSKEQSSPIGTS